MTDTSLYWEPAARFPSQMNHSFDAWCGVCLCALAMPEDFLSLVVIAFKFARNLAQRLLKLSFVIISLVTSDQPSKVVD